MLSEAQKYKIIRHLCYPNGTLDSGSLDYSNIVVGKLNRIDGQAQIEVEQLLEWIDQTEDQIDASVGSQRVKRVDDIEFFENSTDELRKQKSKYINDLSSFIGIPSRCKGGVMGGVCV
jgi:hypothetical protein